jgi:hypothetical protein
MSSSITVKTTAIVTDKTVVVPETDTSQSPTETFLDLEVARALDAEMRNILEAKAVAQQLRSSGSQKSALIRNGRLTSDGSYMTGGKRADQFARCFVRDDGTLTPSGQRALKKWEVKQEPFRFSKAQQEQLKNSVESGERSPFPLLRDWNGEPTQAGLYLIKLKLEIKEQIRNLAPEKAAELATLQVRRIRIKEELRQARKDWESKCQAELLETGKGVE